MFLFVESENTFAQQYKYLLAVLVYHLKQES